MNTKGVASVRSPVCNLQQHAVEISHEAFSDAVVQAFRDAYSDVCSHCIMGDHFR